MMHVTDPLTPVVPRAAADCGAAPPAFEPSRRPSTSLDTVSICRRHVDDARGRIELLTPAPAPWLRRVESGARLVALAALGVAGVGILLGLAVGAPAASLAATTYWLRLGIVVGGTWLIARGVEGMVVEICRARVAARHEAYVDFYHATWHLERAACLGPRGLGLRPAAG